MDKPVMTVELQRWVVEKAMSGCDPDAVLKPLLDQGWEEQDAFDAIESAVREHLRRNAEQTGLPLPVRVPAPIIANGSSIMEVGDRQVQVVANMLLPRVIVFGGFLSDEECEAMIEMARPKLSRSTTVDLSTGGDLVHEARTSRGTYFPRGHDALCSRIEARIAKLLDWPLDHGEGLQVLNYGKGAEYRPHYDYFDPGTAGGQALLERGGQRVASLVMYLNTPECGGATTFPDVKFEVAAIRGNAVFFSYDRPHPMTKTLHGGAPVLAGEKWVATKWLRERRHE